MHKGLVGDPDLGERGGDVLGLETVGLLIQLVLFGRLNFALELLLATRRRAAGQQRAASGALPCFWV